MRAVVYRESGPPEVLEYVEIDKPTPGEHEVLIRVRAASINPLDWRLMRGGPAIFNRLTASRRRKRPVRPGRDVAGVVEAVGANLTRFKAGDAVFGCCRGAFAEYASGPESALAAKPDAVTFEQAAAVPIAAITALQGLRDHGHVQAGQKVLINGAAGGVGTFAVQLAKAFGAEVTGVCSSANVELVRSIGADHVVDYSREDFTKGTAGFDVLLDNVGNLPLGICRRVLNRTGRCVIIGSKSLGTTAARAAAAPLLSLIAKQHFGMFIAKMRADDLALLADWIAARKVTPVIDRRFALEQAREAFRYVETGHARGKVVITLD